MKEQDGWNREERLERISSLPEMQPVKGQIASLLQQVREVASFLRYYNFEGMPEGYFDEMLYELQQMQSTPEGEDCLLPEGDMEPSQALLWIFIQQMHTLLTDFGSRWKELPLWYYQEILRVKPLSPCSERLWAYLHKNSPGQLQIEKGTPFLATDEAGKQTFSYRMTETAQPTDTEITEVVSLWYEHGTPLSPAREWGCVTSLHKQDPRQIPSGTASMFGHTGSRSRLSPIGFTIVSPSLLIREGKRKVTLTLEAENQPLTAFLTFLQENAHGTPGLSPGEKLSRKLIEDIFYIRISTPEGWMAIDRRTISADPQHPDNLIVHFSLEEEFPPTIPCDPQLHGFASAYPALQLWLQPDAWLYPYSWLKEFLLRRIHIEVSVEDITHLLVYNELGRLDTSKPFQPFGLTAGRGSWFAVGNYEMAVKPLCSAGLKLQWGTLPDDPEGLKGYYREYDCDIDNTSFRIQPRYLTDHTWNPVSTDHSLYLFATATGSTVGMPLPDAPLAPESRWNPIPLESMRPVVADEEQYDYSIASNSGFLSFVLEDPAMGFGQERYRYLFTNRMIRDIRRRKELRPLNVPWVPIVERITLSYQSHETIDLHATTAGERNQVYHISPLGQEIVFPAAGHASIPLIHSLPGHAHLLLGLRHVSPGERLAIYLSFHPLRKEIPGDVLPRVAWYYGDGYNWKEFPDLSLIRDTTRGLLTSGCVTFDLPDDYPADHSSTLWLRAAVMEHEEYIPPLQAVYTPVVELLWEPGDAKNTARRRQLRDLLPGRKVPGITGAQIVSPFSGGRDSESETERLCRISEYVTHRGRALLPRDYEWLVLQLFPQIRKVKCLPGYDPYGQQKGVVSLVVVPDTGEDIPIDRLPHASSDLLHTIRTQLLTYMPAAVRRIEVFNPAYEELMVRCQVSFHEQYAIGNCRRQLRQLCDRFIASWYFLHQPPPFGQLLSVRELREEITRQEYVSSVQELSLVRMSEYKGNHLLEEYKGTGEELRPLLPHGVFIPFQEHLFLSEAGTPFGVGEMTIDSSWIIGKELTTP